MSFFDWVIKILGEYSPMLLRGAETTLIIAISGTIIGFILGLLTGIFKTIPMPDNKWGFRGIIQRIINTVINVYVEVFRGTPMIVQAMVIFYGTLTLLNIRDFDRTLAGIIIVSINTGAYMTEIMRGGIISVDKGQFEAAHAIGMNHWQTMTNVVLPQAIRNILPATGNEFVINIKDTSVLSVISVTDLYFQGKTIASNSYRIFETYFVICVIYFILTFTITRLLRLLERKLDGPSNYRIHGSQTMPETELLPKEGK